MYFCVDVTVLRGAELQRANHVNPSLVEDALHWDWLQV